MRTGAWSRAGALALIVGSSWTLLALGCTTDTPDECDPDDPPVCSASDGGAGQRTAKNCIYQDSPPVLESKHWMQEEQACGTDQQCVVVSRDPDHDGRPMALCVWGSAPDPRCTDGGSGYWSGRSDWRAFCADGLIQQCNALGYVFQRFECSEEFPCVSAPARNAAAGDDPLVFCGEQGQPQERCPSIPASADVYTTTTAVCQGPEGFECNAAGYVIERRDCGDYQTCHVEGTQTGDTLWCVDPTDG